MGAHAWGFLRPVYKTKFPYVEPPVVQFLRRGTRRQMERVSPRMDKCKSFIVVGLLMSSEVQSRQP